MSLKKQLLITIMLLFFLLFIGTFFLSGFYTRHYLADQLKSNTQNTATSLGLSITTLLQQNDKQRMLLMVQTVFDSGYYTKVVITDLQGKTIIERNQAVHLSNVPEWFTRLVALDSPTGTAQIMSGWQRIGEVQVTGHPGFAYVQLWQTLWGLLGWFILITILLALLAILALRKILMPLKHIQQQAEDICERKFTIQEKLPSAKELKPVVIAMNKMSLKIQQTIQQQTEDIQRLNKEAYVDNLTGLFNRNYLYSVLQELIANKTSFVSASLAILEITGIEDIKHTKGFPVFNAILKQINEFIRNNMVKGDTAARLDNRSYALLCINRDANDTINALIQSLASLKEQQQQQGNSLDFHIGVYQFQEATSVSEIMSAVDNELKQAQAQLKNYHQGQQKNTRQEIKSATEWLSILDDAINNDLFMLYFQPVKDITTQTIFHYEAFLRIKDSDKILSAQQFFPYAELFGKAHLLDKLAIEKIMPIVAAHPELHFAINLSNQTLQSTEFRDWFSDYLCQHKEITKGIIFETSERYLVNSLKEVSELFKIIKNASAKFGIDNFGRSFSNFGYLQQILPDYIKMSGAFSEHIDEDTKMQFFVKSIVQIAHSLDCKAIACNVEKQSQADSLRILKVDGLQGYLIGNIISQNGYF